MSGRPRPKLPSLRALAERAVARNLIDPGELTASGAWPITERYEVLEVLGRGAAGTVLRARDISLEREVAIKLLDAEKASARFAQEARVLAGLRHEYIVPIYDAGTHDGVPFYVMALSTGGTLADAELELEPWVRALIQVCLACDAAHAQGIVHRDLKPENVLLSDGRPLIADFGVAKLLRPVDDAPDARHTRTGAWVGTPIYMAPEQMGDGEVSAAADIHALGVMLFERLTGRLPFRGQTTIELAAQILGDDRPDPQAIAPDAPPRLCAVARRAIARDPAARYASAHDLAAALDAALRPADAPTAARATDQAPLIALLLGGVAVLLAAGIWLALRDRPRPAGEATGGDPTPAVSDPTPLAASDPTPPAASDLPRPATPSPSASASPPRVEPSPAEPELWATLAANPTPSPALFDALSAALDRPDRDETLERFTRYVRQHVISTLPAETLRDALDPSLRSPIDDLVVRAATLPAPWDVELVAHLTVLRSRYVAIRVFRLDQDAAKVAAAQDASPRWQGALCLAIWRLYAARVALSMGKDGHNYALLADAALAEARRRGAPAAELEPAHTYRESLR